ncbi:MAG: aminoglycoside 6-adenylyltransferase [Chloroflexales bacterium]|nr:aminoglycoside 6-adenylyltransferase [Chloroflexales bacterium]
MNDTNNSPDIAQKLVQWAEQREEVRAMLLTSTRAVPHAPTDVLSDYDVILVMQDIRPYFDDRTWLRHFGDVLVAYWDPIFPDPDYGIEQSGNVIQFADGLKIDFTLWPVAILQRIVAAPMLPDELDAGYRVLLDKDGLAAGLRAPTHKAFVPSRPTSQAFQTFVEEFFSDAPYVAKCLWRDELLPAKWCLDYDMKHAYLRPMLEWRVQCDHSWSMAAGNLGKGLKKRLPPDIWAHLERCYAGASIVDNWDALLQTLALFRRVAGEVADHLGYIYPLALDQGVVAYVQQIRRIDR